MLYLHFLFFKGAFNRKILYKLFWKCFEKCTHKLRVPVNTFRYTVKMDKLTFQTPVAVWNSWWFMLQNSLETLIVLSKTLYSYWEPSSKITSQAQASDSTLPFWEANRQIPVRTMTGFGRKWWKWCNSTVSKNPRQLLPHRTQLGCCRGQDKDKGCFAVSPHHTRGFTRKNWGNFSQQSVNLGHLT